MEVQGDDVQIVRLREAAHRLMPEVLGEQIQVGTGPRRRLHRDVEVVPVVVDDDLRPGVDNPSDAVRDRRLHHVEGAHEVHAERHHGVGSHDREVHDGVHPLGRRHHLVRVGHIDPPELMVAARRAVGPPPCPGPIGVVAPGGVQLIGWANVAQAQLMSHFESRNRRLRNWPPGAVEDDPHCDPPAAAGAYPMARPANAEV